MKSGAADAGSQAIQRDVIIERVSDHQRIQGDVGDEVEEDGEV